MKTIRLTDDEHTTLMTVIAVMIRFAEGGTDGEDKDETLEELRALRKKLLDCK